DSAPPTSAAAHAAPRHRAPSAGPRPADNRPVRDNEAQTRTASWLLSFDFSINHPPDIDNELRKCVEIREMRAMLCAAPMPEAASSQYHFLDAGFAVRKVPIHGDEGGNRGGGRDLRRRDAPMCDGAAQLHPRALAAHHPRR